MMAPLRLFAQGWPGTVYFKIGSKGHRREGFESDRLSLEVGGLEPIWQNQIGAIRGTCSTGIKVVLQGVNLNFNIFV